jgi:hypothetical protein
MIYNDEIISEVWRNRDAYVKKHKHDLRRIIMDLKNRQKKSQCKIINRRMPNKGTRSDAEIAARG